jgi:hypothetical protein
MMNVAFVIWRRACLPAAFAASVIVAGGTVGAQSPAPLTTPSASPSPPANVLYVHAHATAIATPGGAPIRLVARVAVARSGDRTRFDILSVAVSSSPMQLQGLVVVVDAHAKTVTVWNALTHLYATQPLPFFNTAPPTPPAGASRAPGRERSGLADLELFALDVHLLGHRTILGLPSTGLGMALKIRRRSDRVITRITGSAQLADDFAFLPLAIDLKAQDTKPVGSLAYAVDSFARVLPPGFSFDVPSGYRVAPSLLGVAMSSFGALPAVTPSPAPAATPT